MRPVHYPPGTSRTEVRRAQFLAGIDPLTSAGLEIGALNRPTLRAADCDIGFVDFTDTEALRRHYAAVPGVNVADIVPVDFVWTPGSRLAEVIGRRRFDFVLASHVIEHAPNLIGWLLDIADWLKEGGVLSLIIPDKRFTFDCERDVTTRGEVVGHFIQGTTRPTPAQVFNHLAYHVRPAADGSTDVAGRPRLARVHADEEALKIAQIIWSTQEYYDVHCTIFTPESALDLLEALFRMRLIPYRVCNFVPTHTDEIDFFLMLERLGDADPQALVASQLESIRRARELESSATED